MIRDFRCPGLFRFHLKVLELTMLEDGRTDGMASSFDRIPQATGEGRHDLVHVVDFGNQPGRAASLPVVPFVAHHDI